MSTHPALTAFGIGEVDLLGDLRVTRTHRTEAVILALRTQVVVASAAAGLEAPVAPTSTDFRDLDAFAESTRLALDLGFRSRTAIHPAQVPVIHDVLTPTADEVAAAQDVVGRYEASEAASPWTARGGSSTAPSYGAPERRWRERARKRRYDALIAADWTILCGRGRQRFSALRRWYCCVSVGRPSSLASL